MNTYYLKRFRKRFTVIYFSFKEHGYVEAQLIDHKTKEVTNYIRCSNQNLIDDVIQGITGFFAYSDWRKKRYKRQVNAKYKAALK